MARAMSRSASGNGLRLLGAFLVFAVLELLLLRPALELPFVSDDIHYIELNATVQSLSGENVAAILDPRGEPARDTANYAPVHLLAHALEWSLFGSQVLGYHVVNALLHALNAALLAALLVRRGLSLAVGVGAAGLFLLHPANVETAAWISQLKTLLALTLALGALLLEPRRPLAGLLLFGLACLSKASALFAVPVAAVFAWVDASAGAAWRRRAGWLCGWVGVALAYAPLQLSTFERAEASALLHPDLSVHLRSVVAIAGRYVAIAFTGAGVAPFHEPLPATSWLDPWWLFGAVAVLLLAGRAVVALRQRREEAAWWVWVAAAYLPVSQIYRFLYPMADRYLYFVLPGLIGVLAFLFRDDDVWPRVAARVRPWLERLPTGVTPARAAALPALLLAALFVWQSHAQARVWRSPVHMALATEARYPQGSTAHLLRARRAALRGDPMAAAQELQGAVAAGYDRFMDVRSDPDFAAVVRHPEVDGVLREMAAVWIATFRARSDPSYRDLYWVAVAHVLREEFDEAISAYERALARGGRFDGRIRSDLATVRAHVAAGARDGGGETVVE